MIDLGKSFEKFKTMLFNLHVVEERFEEIQKQFPYTRFTPTEIDAKGQQWGTVFLVIDNDVDATKLFHAGINFGMKIISETIVNY